LVEDGKSNVGLRRGVKSGKEVKPERGQRRPNLEGGGQNHSEPEWGGGGSNSGRGGYHLAAGKKTRLSRTRPEGERGKSLGGDCRGCLKKGGDEVSFSRCRGGQVGWGEEVEDLNNERC